MIRTLLVIGVATTILSAQTPPDNSKVNQRDKEAKTVTAEDQGNSKEDVARTAAIRKGVNEQSALSTYAKNIKIITRDGMVTLRGPVRDAEERTRIAKIAADVAGEKQVKNELEIAPKQ